MATAIPKTRTAPSRWAASSSSESGTGRQRRRSWRGVGIGCLLLAGVAVAGEPELVVLPQAEGDYAASREALVEAIEQQGLTVSNVFAFGAMLDRTGPQLGLGASPYLQAETLQFCSARVAWAVVGEGSEQLALCPLAISIYVARAQPATVTIAYRTPGTATPARAQADALLRTIAGQAVLLGRRHWR